MRKLLAALFLAAGLAAGYFYWWPSELPRVAFLRVQQGNLVSYLTTNGRIEASESFDLYAETTGLVSRVAVQQGEEVQKGAELLTIDDQSARAALRQAEAQLAMARAELVTIERGGTPAEIAELQDQLGRARRSREQLKTEVAALERLVGKQAVPRVELEAAVERLATAESEVALLDQKIEEPSAPEQRERALARIREAESAVALARGTLGAAVVRSPIDGVVYSLAVRPGAFVNAGTLVARVGDISRVRVVILVDEPELGRLELDDPVTVTADAYPAKQWHCQLDRLPAEIVTDGARRVGEIHCTVENTTGELIPNLTVDVRIQTATADQALTVPREAVYREDGQTLVWIAAEGDTAEPRPVTLGIASATAVEVTSGLATGDRVLLPGQTELAAGQRLRLVESGAGS